MPNAPAAAKEIALRAISLGRKIGRGVARIGQRRTAAIPADWSSDVQSLMGKVVLITGSTRGIGRAAASLFARQGAKVGVHGRDLARAQAIAQQLRSGGTEAFGYGTDLSVPGAARQLVRDVIRDFGSLDVLVNNAAILPQHKDVAWKLDPTEFATVMATNVNAMFDGTTEAMRWMVENRRPGRIINVSSPAASLVEPPMPGLVAYGISKAALEAVSHYLADEAKQAGIVLTTLRAPTTDTDMIATHIDWELRGLQVPPAAAAEAYIHAAMAPAEKVHGLVHSL